MAVDRLKAPLSGGFLFGWSQAGFEDDPYSDPIWV